MYVYIYNSVLGNGKQRGPVDPQHPTIWPHSSRCGALRSRRVPRIRDTALIGNSLIKKNAGKSFLPGGFPNPPLCKEGRSERGAAAVCNGDSSRCL